MTITFFLIARICSKARNLTRQMGHILAWYRNDSAQLLHKQRWRHGKMSVSRISDIHMTHSAPLSSSSSSGSTCCKKKQIYILSARITNMFLYYQTINQMCHYRHCKKKIFLLLIPSTKVAKIFKLLTIFYMYHLTMLLQWFTKNWYNHKCVSKSYFPISPLSLSHHDFNTS